MAMCCFMQLRAQNSITGTEQVRVESPNTWASLPLKISSLIDSIATVDQVHSAFVGFEGKKTEQYMRFERLIETADCQELLACTQYPNATVRAYAFWALARRQYAGLDSVLLAHARDEDLISEIQGGVINRIPVIEFMQWIVRPDMMDGSGTKLDPEVLQRVARLRFAEERP